MTLEIAKIFQRIMLCKPKHTNVVNGGKMPDNEFIYYSLIPKLDHYKPITVVKERGIVTGLIVYCNPILRNEYAQKIKEIVGDRFNVSPNTNTQEIVITLKTQS